MKGRGHKLQMKLSGDEQSRSSQWKDEDFLKIFSTEEQYADILTKPLGQKTFEFLRKCLGMMNNPAADFKGECWKY